MGIFLDTLEAIGEMQGKQASPLEDVKAPGGRVDPVTLSPTDAIDLFNRCVQKECGGALGSLTATEVVEYMNLIRDEAGLAPLSIETIRFLEERFGKR